MVNKRTVFDDLEAPLVMEDVYGEASLPMQLLRKGVLGIVKELVDLGNNEGRMLALACKAYMHALDRYEEAKIARTKSENPHMAIDGSGRELRFILAAMQAEMFAAIQGKDLYAPKRNNFAKRSGEFAQSSGKRELLPQETEKLHKIIRPELILTPKDFIERLGHLNTNYLKDNRFEMLRDEMGISIRELSQMPNMPSRDTIEKLETDFSPNMLTGVVAKVANSFNVSLEYFLGISDDRGCAGGTRVDKSVYKYIFDLLAQKYGISKEKLHLGLGVNTRTFSVRDFDQDMKLEGTVNMHRLSDVPIADFLMRE